MLSTDAFLKSSPGMAQPTFSGVWGFEEMIGFSRAELLPQGKGSPPTEELRGGKKARQQLCVLLMGFAGEPEAELGRLLATRISPLLASQTTDKWRGTERLFGEEVLVACSTHISEQHCRGFRLCSSSGLTGGTVHTHL